MKLIRFLVRYSPRSLALAVLAGVISGASNAGLLALFNAALKDESGSSKATMVLLFIALCLFLPVTRFVSEVLLARLSQGALFNLRAQLSDQILSAPLRHLEEMGIHRLMTALTDDIPTITSTIVVIPVICINIATTISGLVYLGILSMTALLAVLGFMALGIVTYQLPVIKALNAFREARKHADELFQHFRDLTEGVKELKLSARRRRAFLSEALRATAESFQRHNVSAMTINAAAASWGQVLVFIVIGLIVFALPTAQEMSLQTLTGYTITLLYLMSPLQVIMLTIPTLSRANVALQKVESLGLELKAGGIEIERDDAQNSSLLCERVDLIGVTHTYHREGENTSFTLGPIDLTFSAGDLIFLVGGNGSGKTTLAKLLTGLYAPEAGEIRLNGRAVEDENREHYREHFSVVFSDFHLFESLLGLDSPDLDEKARGHLRSLQLSHKVQIDDGALSTTELSQGQRKRLALLTAYLEDRPVYVFDEWAADQDPVFKKVFYHEILPEMKARGKAVLVISHDDHYYDVADRIIKLESGKIEYDRPVRDIRQASSGLTAPM